MFYGRLTTTVFHSDLSNILPLAQSLEDKRRYTSSIIRVLDEDDDLRMSTANARARICQAEIILESGNDQEAIDEITKAIQLLTSPALLETTTKIHDTLLAKAYRVAADAYEQTGDYNAAIDSIQRMASTNFDLRTKVVKELERLQQLARAA
jgi:tetratricopeptide (TPR) repeat protein